MQEKILKIANYHGRETQSVRIIKETSELSDILMKTVIRLQNGDISDYGEKWTEITKAVARVEVMLEQIKILYVLSDWNIDLYKKEMIESDIKEILKTAPDGWIDEKPYDERKFYDYIKGDI